MRFNINTDCHAIYIERLIFLFLKKIKIILNWNFSQPKNRVSILMTEFKFFYWILTSAFNPCNSVAFKIFNIKNKSQFLPKYGANDCSQYLCPTLQSKRVHAELIKQANNHCQIPGQ